MSTKFFNNENGNSLFKKFNGAYEHNIDMHAFHAIVGYFRASGYFSIRKQLLKVPEVKILVGIEVNSKLKEHLCSIMNLISLLPFFRFAYEFL